MFLSVGMMNLMIIIENMRCFTQTSIEKWLFRVPGLNYQFSGGSTNAKVWPFWRDLLKYALQICSVWVGNIMALITLRFFKQHGTTAGKIGPIFR